jgi:transposase
MNTKHFYYTCSGFWKEHSNPLSGDLPGPEESPIQYQPFLRCVWAKCFFKIDTNTDLIERLKNDPNLRLLCGFKTVPGRSTFSRNFAGLSATVLMSETLDALVKDAHQGRVVYHVSRDSTAIEVRKKAEKKHQKEEKAAWKAQKRGDSTSKTGNRS